MTTMTPGEVDTLWTAIDDQRGRTADLLETLTDEQWEHPSLCEAWTVRHVAAHLTLQQERIRDAAGYLARNPRLLPHLTTLNSTIREVAKVQAERLTTDEIIAAIRAMVGKRRHNAFVTAHETLTDILVHGQDIARPLRLPLEMPPHASAMAATRRWDARTSWQNVVFHPMPYAEHTLVATDVDWTRGHGPIVSGPVGSILLLLTGRRVALEDLTGDGADALRARTTGS